MNKKTSLDLNIIFFSKFIAIVSGIIATIIFLNVEPQCPIYKYLLPFIIANYFCFTVFIIFERIDLLFKTIKRFFADSNSLLELIFSAVIFIMVIIFIVLPFFYLVLIYIHIDFANLILNFIGKTAIEPTTEQKFIFWLSAGLLSIAYKYISPKDK